MAKFGMDKRAQNDFEKQVAKATQEAIEAVTKRHAGGSDSTIKGALVREMKARGFADFKPTKELIDAIKNAGK